MSIKKVRDVIDNGGGTLIEKASVFGSEGGIVERSENGGVGRDGDGEGAFVPCDENAGIWTGVVILAGLNCIETGVARFLKVKLTSLEKLSLL